MVAKTTSIANCGEDMLNGALPAAEVLDFQKFEILTVCLVYGANMHHRAKCYQKQSNGCEDMAI